MDGMSELAIAYILQGVLKALDYIHHMGYVHRYLEKKKTIHFLLLEVLRNIAHQVSLILIGNYIVDLTKV